MTCREQKKISSGLGEMWKGLEMEENEKRKVVRYVSLIHLSADRRGVVLYNWAGTLRTVGCHPVPLFEEITGQETHQHGATWS